MILNEYDVAFAVERVADRDDLPNLRSAAVILARLVEWTNANSDGWAYWRKPSAASKQLQTEVHRRLIARSKKHDRYMVELTDRELKQVLGHVKAFLTRQQVPEADRATILGSHR